MSDQVNSSTVPEKAVSDTSSSNEDWDYLQEQDERVYLQPHRSESFSSTNSVGRAASPENLSFMDLLDPSFTVKVSKKAFTKVKSRTERIKNRAKKEKDKLIEKMNDEDLIILKEKMMKRLEKFDENFMKTVVASKTEKLFYSFALFQIFYAGILIGKYPQYFHLYYSFLFCLLMPIRLYTYWKRDFQYFLADFCYYVNILCMCYIWLFPASEHLYMVCFSFTYGTLAFAVITWRNSLVLHSIEKITSSFIHIIPPVTLFVITHELDSETRAKRFPGAAKVTTWNSINGILWSSLYYLVWQSLYHYFITYKSKDELKKGRVTSFSWLRRSYAKKPIGKFVNGLPEPLPVIVFTLIQFGYQLGTMSFCPIWIKYRRFASLFLASIFIIASYNGATYYLDVFGKKLEREVTKLQNEIQLLQAENLMNNNSAFTSSSSLISADSPRSDNNNSTQDILIHTAEKLEVDKETRKTQ